ncbi:DUF6531 domain-containing protein [Streptomyces sp. NPDC050095]|uniref:DUF6531 domain-containing protein n=1 Tax=unclassified Streptomyces TaxID=2593676 RepID=UPI00343B3670
MGYTIPGWLDDVLDFIGINFPNVDEDDYREMADAMREFADKFEGHGGDAHKAFSRILSSSEGWAVDSMEQHWNQIKASHLEKLPELARLFADACDILADIIFGMKTKAEIELGAMAASVGISAGLAVVTGGLSALIGAGEVAAMRQVVKRIIDEAVDRIVDEVLAKITQPINAKLESMVEDMVLDLAEGAFHMPPADGSGGGGKHGGGMHIASAGAGAMQIASAGGGAQKRTHIDHFEFEDGAGKVSKHGGELHLAASSSLGKARGAFGRSKGRDPFTQAFDSVLHGALKGSEKALGKVAKHLTDTVPERVKGASRLHKGKDHDVREKVEAILDGKKHGDGKGDGHRKGDSGSPLKIDEARKNDPDLVDRAKDARALSDKETCGDPIDMASGQLVMAQTDVDLPGVLPLILRRTHLSGYGYGRFFGPSWASTLDERLADDRESGGIRWYREDGSVLLYPRRPDLPGDHVLPVMGHPLPLTCITRGTTYVLAVRDPHTGLTRFFESATEDGDATDATDAMDAMDDMDDTDTWWLTAVEDRNGNTVGIDRDEAGTPQAITHTGGYVLEAGSEPVRGRPRVTALHALTGDGPVRLRAFAYDDATAALTEVRNAVDAPLHLTYDDAHRITGWRDSNDTTFAYEYDAQGRVSATRGTDGFLNSTVTYGDPDQAGATTATYTDSLGNTTVYRANRHGQIVAVTDPLGAMTTQRWDSRDHLLSRTDPLGNTTRWEWDDAGDLVSITTPDGNSSRIAYNALHLPTEWTGPDGRRSVQTFDERGNLTVLVAPDGGGFRWTHDSTGAVTTVTDALGHTTAAEHDGAGLVLRLTDPLGAVSTCRRDGFGRVVEIADPLGAVTRMEWTAEGRPARLTAADGSVESWTWDGEGNCTSHTDATGSVTRFEYTHFDLLAARTGPDGARYEFEHDTELRLGKVTGPQGLTWAYTYDEAGRLIAETDFDERQVRYGHDAAGRLTSRRDSAGGVLRFERDAQGRVVRKDADGTITAFVYSRAGDLVGATGPDAELALERDAVGRLVAETVNGRATRYTYDRAGRRVSRTTPAGARTEWSYDAAGNPAGLVAAGRSLTFAHDAAGREVTRSVGDLTLTRRYDPLGRAVRQELTGPDDSTLLGRGYTYRPDGSLAAVDDLRSGRRRFDLDPVGRITAVHATRWSETYAYDAAGNQLRAQWPENMPGRDAVGERTYEGTRVRSAGRVRYEYDAAGRTTVRTRSRLSRRPEVWRYTWDAESRLTRVVTPDGVAWRYRYDPLGRRIAKERLAADGQDVVERTDFVWDGTTLAEQTTSVPEAGPPALTLTWEHRGLHPVCQIESKHVSRDGAETDARFFAIVTDLVGTPTELVDEHGTVAWRTRATVWGDTAWNKGAEAYTPLRFPGQYADHETRLHYNYFRHYDPETARYTGPDPLGLGPAANPVAYVHHPLTWSDPLGLAADHNPEFDTRREAFNAARDMAGIPNSSQPTHQWTIGGDPTQAGRANYVYRPYDPNADPDRDPRAGWGRYYQYDTPDGTRVIAEHTDDPRAPYPHFHAGKPPEGSPRDINMQGKTYKQIQPKHHFYYTGGRCNGK